MAAPPYMRFYPDAFCKNTLSLTMEEQGAYIRLLCAMWKHGGKIRDDDRFIAKALPIHINKWRKVKPQLMPFLKEHSPGFLTQKKLSLEYHYSSGDKSENTDATPQVTSLVTTPVTPQVTRGVPPPVTPLVDEAVDKNTGIENNEEIHRVEAVPTRGVAHALARALDQSRFRSNKNKEFRSLEDSDDDFCGKLDEATATRFINEAIAVFDKHRLMPPADYTVVNNWVTNGCDLFLHVLPAVEIALNRINSATDPPKSWKYFTHEVYGCKKSKKGK